VAPRMDIVGLDLSRLLSPATHKPTREIVDKRRPRILTTVELVGARNGHRAGLRAELMEQQDLSPVAEIDSTQGDA